jgi:hypothetical protein
MKSGYFLNSQIAKFRALFETVFSLLSLRIAVIFDIVFKIVTQFTWLQFFSFWKLILDLAAFLVSLNEIY